MSLEWTFRRLSISLSFNERLCINKLINVNCRGYLLVTKNVEIAQYRESEWMKKNKLNNKNTFQTLIADKIK